MIKEVYIAKWNNYPEDEVKIRVARPRVLRQIEDIIELSKTKTIRLICYEREPPCHRFILMDMIKYRGEMDENDS